MRLKFLRLGRGRQNDSSWDSSLHAPCFSGRQNQERRNPGAHAGRKAVSVAANVEEECVRQCGGPERRSDLHGRQRAFATAWRRSAGALFDSEGPHGKEQRRRSILRPTLMRPIEFWLGTPVPMKRGKAR